MTQRESYIDIFTPKPEPCEWGAWNQYMIFMLLEEKPWGDKIRIIGKHDTIKRFLQVEGYGRDVPRIRVLPA